MRSGGAFTWLCSAQVERESPGGFHQVKVWVTGVCRVDTGMYEVYLYRCVCTGVCRVVTSVCKVYLYRFVCAGVCRVITGVCKVYLYRSVLGSSAGWELQVQAVPAAFRYTWKLWVGGSPNE